MSTDTRVRQLALRVPEKSRSAMFDRYITSFITGLSISELARLVRQKQLSPVEVIDAYLQRIEQINPRVNAFAYIDGERAKAAAKRAEMALMSGERPRPLLGVAVTVKSCIDVPGMRCGAGSGLGPAYVAAEDARLEAGRE